jgi:hypothetical protein
MGLVLTTTAGLIVWIVGWALGYKAFDAFLVTLLILVFAVAARLIMPALPGSRGDETPPPGA